MPTHITSALGKFFDDFHQCYKPWFFFSFPPYLGKTNVCSAIIKDMKRNQLLRHNTMGRKKKEFFMVFRSLFLRELDTIWLLVSEKAERRPQDHFPAVIKLFTTFERKRKMKNLTQYQKQFCTKCLRQFALQPKRHDKLIFLGIKTQKQMN